MAQTIPVSQVVTINPAVVGTGGNPLALNGVILTQSATTPVGPLLSFPSADDVTTYFGSGSTESRLASRYFLGFDNSTKKPGNVFFAAYATTDRAAWLRGIPLAGLTLPELKTITGTLSVTVDGVAHTDASVDLSAATSFTNAAALLTTGLALTGSAAVTWDAAQSRFVVTSGTTGATSTMTVATGTAAAPLGLSAGILSQGAVADTPATAMDRVKNASANWATFMTVFEPDLAMKTAFVDWVNAQNQRYLYAVWDTDLGALVTDNDTTFGKKMQAAKPDGVLPLYNTPDLAAFVCGMIASIDWNATNGRITLAFKTQSGLPTTVNTLADASALLSNGYSYFGAYAAQGEGNEFNFLYDGAVPGKWLWADPYINQIFMNSQLQLAIISGLTAVNSTPYNEMGYTFIRAWCNDPIQQALNNGTIRVGVPLSSAQKAQINSAAGLDITRELEDNGYYLQILPATAQTRGNRQSPPINFWYMDGGAIQQITLASIAVL